VVLAMPSGKILKDLFYLIWTIIAKKMDISMIGCMKIPTIAFQKIALNSTPM